MNKKIVTRLGIIMIPVGAIFLTACGPVEGMDGELALDTASDNFFPGPLEYGHCNDTQDNDGNGLVDMHDPACHLNPGPLRDLSLYDFPIGHNFFPDHSKILPGGPGWGGGFRNPEQITRWFRFLTEPDGNVAGTSILAPGVNPEVVPIPAILPVKIRQGTWAHGNNNNVSLRGLHTTFLDHGFLPGAAAAVAPSSGLDPAQAFQQAGSAFIPSRYKTTRGITGGWPGGFYRGGSQGGLVGARTGN